MQLTVKLFGAEAQAVGQRHVTLTVREDAVTCGQLRRLLGDAQPVLRPMLAHCRFAINHQFARDAQPVGPTDEVALIGMVSGG